MGLELRERRGAVGRLEEVAVVLEDLADRLPHPELVVHRQDDGALGLRRFEHHGRAPGYFGSGTFRTTYSFRPPPRWR